jgi:hypothetical protein
MTAPQTVGGAQLLGETAAAALEVFRCAIAWEVASKTMSDAVHGDIPSTAWKCSGIDGAMEILIDLTAVLSDMHGTQPSGELDHTLMELAWQTAAGAPAPPPAADVVARSACPCQWAKAEMHDELLTLEALPFPDMVEILDGIVSQVGCRPNHDVEVPWYELPDFVSEHNWRHPVAMCRLASLIETCARRWHEKTPKGYR